MGSKTLNYGSLKFGSYGTLGRLSSMMLESKFKVDNKDKVNDMVTEDKGNDYNTVKNQSITKDEKFISESKVKTNDTNKNDSDKISLNSGKSSNMFSRRKSSAIS